MLHIYSVTVYYIMMIIAQKIHYDIHIYICILCIELEAKLVNSKTP